MKALLFPLNFMAWLVADGVLWQEERIYDSNNKTGGGEKKRRAHECSNLSQSNLPSRKVCFFLYRTFSYRQVGLRFVCFLMVDRSMAPHHFTGLAHGTKLHGRTSSPSTTFPDCTTTD